MRRLEELLADLSPSEREEALMYYDSYISDSGKENEAAVLEALGTPEKVAATIKEGLDGGGGEFTEAGFRSNAESGGGNQVMSYHSAAGSGQGTEQTAQNNPNPGKRQRSSGEIAIIIILVILASPLLIGLGGGLLGVLLGIAGAIFGVAVAFVAVFLALLLGGFSLVIAGFIALFGSPLVGLSLLSAGLLTTGFGAIFLAIIVLVCGKLIPFLWNGICDLFRKITSRKKGAKND
jgi:uncharacterized membrane protein